MTASTTLDFVYCCITYYTTTMEKVWFRLQCITGHLEIDASLYIDLKMVSKSMTASTTLDFVYCCITYNTTTMEKVWFRLQGITGLLEIDATLYINLKMVSNSKSMTASTTLDFVYCCITYNTTTMVWFRLQCITGHLEIDASLYINLKMVSKSMTATTLDFVYCCITYTTQQLWCDSGFNA